MNKKKIIIITTIALLWFWSVAWWYYYFKVYKNQSWEQTTTQDVYYTVWTWDIATSIKVLWETNLLQEQKLKFNIDWEIKKVNVKVWDKVKAWDILAELDKTELQNDLKQANITYENAKIALDKLVDKSNNEDKIKDQTSLDDKKRKLDMSTYDLDKLKTDNEQKLKDKQKEIDDLKDSLEKLKIDSKTQSQEINDSLSDKKRDLDYKTATIQDEKWKLQKSIDDEKKSLNNKINDYNKSLINTYNQIDNDLNSIEDNLRVLNQALRIDNDLQKLEDNFFYSAKNSTIKNKATTYYWKTKAWYLDLQSKLSSLDKDKLTIDWLSKVLLFEKDIYENMYQTSIQVAAWADYSVETESFTQSDISSIKSQANSIKTSSATLKSSVDDNVNKLKDADTPETLTKKSSLEVEKLQKDLKDLDINYEKLQKEYSNLSLTTPEKIKALEKSIIDKNIEIQKTTTDLKELKYTTNLSYEDKKIEFKNLKSDYEIELKNFEKKYWSSWESEEIKVARNALKQAEIWIDQVNKKILNYELHSSFDWIIDSLTLKTWDKLSSSNSTDEKFIHLVNPWLMEIKIKLDQIDIVKVSVWVPVNVSFDSYPDKIFTWSINSIDSKPIDDNWTKKYEVKVIIDKWDLNIFSWMSANVEIVFEKKQNVILIPTMSIEMDDKTWTNFITILKDWKKLKQTVEVWLNSDWNTQILSWANVWDQVLQINFDENKFKPEDFNWNSWVPYYWW